MSRTSACMFAIGVVLTVVSLCVAAPKPTAHRTVTVTEKNTKVSLAVGDTLLVRLESTPGTGYGWRTVVLDTKLLKQMGEPVMEDSGKKLLGAPEHQVFKFKAIAVGKTALELHYVRPWEKDKPPERVFKISVRITKASKGHRQ